MILVTLGASIRRQLKMRTMPRVKFPSPEALTPCLDFSPLLCRQPRHLMLGRMPPTKCADPHLPCSSHRGVPKHPTGRFPVPQEHSGRSCHTSPWTISTYHNSQCPPHSARHHRNSLNQYGRPYRRTMPRSHCFIRCTYTMAKMSSRSPPRRLGPPPDRWNISTAQRLRTFGKYLAPRCL